MSDNLAIIMSRGQWLVILEAASNYDVRVPREQGDGGACLEIIAEACEVEVPELRGKR